jgi:hypothetical protein
VRRNQYKQKGEVVTLTSVHPRIFIREILVIKGMKTNLKKILGKHILPFGDKRNENQSKENMGKTHTSSVAMKIKRDVTQKEEKEISVPETKYMEFDTEE